MNPTLKNVLKGAGFQLGVKSVDALAFYALRHSGVPGATLNHSGWYVSVPGLGPLFPSVDDWVLDLGLPVAFFLVGKMSERRNPGRASNFKEMALGAALTGIGTFIHSLVDRAGSQLLPPVGAYPYLDYANPTDLAFGSNYVQQVRGPFNLDYGFPTTNVIHQAPYGQGSEARLPFQRDMRW